MEPLPSGGCPILRPTKHKTTASLVGAMKHHYREIPTANADPARTGDNVDLVTTLDAEQLASVVKQRTKDLVKRRDAVRAVELMLAASDDYWERPDASWMDLAEGYRKFLNEEFGEKNVLAFGVHLDESKPHFYALILPITPDGRLSASHWFDGPSKMSKMLDRLTPHFEHLRMERGRKGIKATHIDVATWHEAQAGNKRAAKLIAAEMERREKAAIERAEIAERRADQAEALLAEANAKLEEVRSLTAAMMKQAQEEFESVRRRALAVDARQATVEAEAAANQRECKRLEQLLDAMTPAQQYAAAERYEQSQQRAQKAVKEAPAVAGEGEGRAPSTKRLGRAP